jgi:hypothetical protein
MAFSFANFLSAAKRRRAGNDVVFIAFLGHNEVVKQTMRLNRRGEVLDRLSSGLADVERRSNKFVQRNANNLESCIHWVFLLLKLGSGAPTKRRLLAAFQF